MRRWVGLREDTTQRPLPPESIRVHQQQGQRPTFSLPSHDFATPSPLRPAPLCRAGIASLPAHHALLPLLAALLCPGKQVKSESFELREIHNRHMCVHGWEQAHVCSQVGCIYTRVSAKENCMWGVKSVQRRNICCRQQCWRGGAI